MDTRPLPPGWVSQWEPSVGRYFYVDTTKNPPISTWDDPRDSPPPYSPPQYSPPQDSPPQKMPVAMPSPETYPNYSASPTYPSYPPSNSTAYPTQPQQGGYPSYPGQPNSYTPYNKYDGAVTASTSAATPKKNGGFLNKLGLGGSKPGKHNNLLVPGAAALGTAATLGVLSHNKHSHHKHHKHGKLGLGSGIGLGLGGAGAGMLIGNSLFGHKGGFGFKSGGWGCDNDWGGGGCDWGDCGW